ncbi:MAG: signal recognition particle-docking protein FtsY [Oceanospirillales bacterium TMED33]|nr:signal recognition particle-docking protein FtsY [Gammaproteobacteria bacterium]RPG19457.1 MAG: signal recognition particle-docking protein FtsY [Oceanospirillales bacterium TMED33]
MFISLFICKCYHLILSFLGFLSAMTFDPLLLVGVAIFVALVVWFLFGRKKAISEEPKQPQDNALESMNHAPVTVENAEPVSFFRALSRSRSQLSSSLKSIFSTGFDEEIREDLEAILLSSDVGVDTTDWVLETLEERSRQDDVSDPDGLLKLLKDILASTLVASTVAVDEGLNKPHVILMVGVNGVGKTTTIGKLAHRYQSDGRSVLLAAGDTFRAAAVEQLKTWGERNRVPVIAQDTGADSASVLFDACESAKARGTDIVLADTAGRLQNKANLMNELEKIGRVLGKLDIGAPHQVLLVLDAGTGQNAISQAREFSKAIQPTGLVLTKLDGTAKGGIVFALSREFGLPIRYVGLGEKAEDLRAFDAEAFVDAMFAEASE